jgi:hypothetical protein
MCHFLVILVKVTLKKVVERIPPLQSECLHIVWNYISLLLVWSVGKKYYALLLYSSLLPIYKCAMIFLSIFTIIFYVVRNYRLSVPPFVSMLFHRDDMWVSFVPKKVEISWALPPLTCPPNEVSRIQILFILV